MKFFNIILLFICYSCLSPESLDGLQKYAESELEGNSKEFAKLEIEKWWDNYFKSESQILLANGKTFESVLQLIDRKNSKEDDDELVLINRLIKLQNLNVVLKTLSFESKNVKNQWFNVCENQRMISKLNLREKIKTHYMSGLKLPSLGETYMIGGGTGKDGLSMTIESIVTNIGSLINREKKERFKRKIQKIKTTFNEKIPSKEELHEISKEVCNQSAQNNHKLIKTFEPLISKMSDFSEKEWSIYQNERSNIGNLLIKRNIQERIRNDKNLRNILGIEANISLKKNLENMRYKLQKTIEDFRSFPNVKNKDELKDFIKSFEEQLHLLKQVHFSNSQDIIQDNQQYLIDVKRNYL